jgi:hypothetical protein
MSWRRRRRRRHTTPLWLSHTWDLRNCRYKLHTRALNTRKELGKKLVELALMGVMCRNSLRCLYNSCKRASICPKTPCSALLGSFLLPMPLPNSKLLGLQGPLDAIHN